MYYWKSKVQKLSIQHALKCSLVTLFLVRYTLQWRLLFASIWPEVPRCRCIAKCRQRHSINASVKLKKTMLFILLVHNHCPEITNQHCDWINFLPILSHSDMHLICNKQVAIVTYYINIKVAFRSLVVQVITWAYLHADHCDCWWTFFHKWFQHYLNVPIFTIND